MRLRAPEVSETLARSVAEAVSRLRALELAKPPGIAEAIDWAQALSLLGVSPESGEALGYVLKNREDLERASTR